MRLSPCLVCLWVAFVGLAYSLSQGGNKWRTRAPPSLAKAVQHHHRSSFKSTSKTHRLDRQHGFKKLSKVKESVQFPEPRILHTPSPPQPVNFRANGRVQIECGGARMVVTVPLDLFANKMPVDPDFLFLGNNPKCKCNFLNQTAMTATFDVKLRDCGSEINVTDDKFIYMNKLVYIPVKPDSVIMRTGGTVLPIECVYNRVTNVSSKGLQPTWIPVFSTKMVNTSLTFRLTLMNDNWTAPTTTKTFSLSSVLKFEASVDSSNHYPMQLFVDRCRASESAAMDSSRSYNFIKHHGCLVDGLQKDSIATFKHPRLQPNVLQFIINAFYFSSDAQNPLQEIYIMCQVKVVPIGQTDNRNKACFYDKMHSRWLSVDGNDTVCRCCSTGTCSSSRKYSNSQKWKRAMGEPLESDESLVVVGPIRLSDENLVPNEEKAFGEKDVGLVFLVGVASMTAGIFLVLLALLLLYKLKNVV
ncbi:zona pellucida sperm-binding protein 3-like isoform X1 [Polypterus senegalus]